jgi:D-alanine-D-alanine ligase
VLLSESLTPPEAIPEGVEKEKQPWRTEYDVISTLKSMGHEVSIAGLGSDLAVIAKAREEHKPHIAFNLLEDFEGQALFDQHVVSYLELLKQAYTGCNPRGLTLAHDKALSKKILSYHRIAVPRFAVFPIGHKVVRPQRLRFPLFVKSAVEEGSVGISQASVVNDDARLAERVEFIHRQTGTQAIAEQYIEGREIYVSVIGNRKMQTYTPWELVINNLPEGAMNIATGRLKWNPDYQKKVGLVTRPADLSPELLRKLELLSKRIYRHLCLSGYARLDYRMTEPGEFYLLEANPNPQIALNEDFADSAAHSGLDYSQLLQKILTLGLSYSAAGFTIIYRTLRQPDAGERRGRLVSIEGAKDLGIAGGQPGVARDIGPRLQLAAVAHEVRFNISAEAEGVHDVFKLRHMRQADGVSEFVNAGQVDDRVSQQRVPGAAARQRLALSRNLRHDVHDRAQPAVDSNALGFAVQPLVRRDPSETNERGCGLFRRRESEFASALARPRVQSKRRQFPVRVAIAGGAFAFFDVVRDRFTRIQRRNARAGLDGKNNGKTGKLKHHSEAPLP